MDTQHIPGPWKKPKHIYFAWEWHDARIDCIADGREYSVIPYMAGNDHRHPHTADLSK